jgi:FMN phosphatase YigB (HAD superfamily)
MPTFKVIYFDLGDTLVRDGAWLPGAMATLQALRAAGYRLGIISNTAQLTRAQLKLLLPADFPWTWFVPELIVLSSEVGVEKPAPAIFKLALDRTGADAAAGRVLFCTEALLDTVAAQLAGMRAVRLVPPSSTNHATDVDTLPSILTML